MLTLYVKTGCPYCAVVLHELAELELPFEEKNIEDDAVAQELIERGGKRQVPYLVDEKNGVEMYESGDIVEYIAITYGNGSAEGSDEDVTSSDSNVCIPDELKE
jgi:anaphase-promoting complex subunit 7